MNDKYWLNSLNSNTSFKMTRSYWRNITLYQYKNIPFVFRMHVWCQSIGYLCMFYRYTMFSKCTCLPSIRRWSVSSSPPSDGTQQQWLRRTSSHISLPLWRSEEMETAVTLRRGCCSPRCGGTVTRWPPCVRVTPAFWEHHRPLLLQRHWTVLCGAWATRARLSWLSYVRH